MTTPYRMGFNTRLLYRSEPVRGVTSFDFFFGNPTILPVALAIDMGPEGDERDPQLTLPDAGIVPAAELAVDDGHWGTPSRRSRSQMSIHSGYLWTSSTTCLMYALYFFLHTHGVHAHSLVS